jgi:ATP-binding cassette subfamily F protein 3
LLFSDVDMEIKRGEHVAIIGDNGTGKTTLLKILNELETADSGEFVLGTKVEIGYYDQEHHVLHSEKTLFDEISDDYPTLTNTEIRNTLAAFLFTGDDVFKRIGDLSGGERGRVSLAKLMLSNANFLILDEPTNHLDITSKEILEQALNGYEGTVLYVSHDRYFVNQTATRILDLANHKFYSFGGNYDYYLEKKETVEGISVAGSAGNSVYAPLAAGTTAPVSSAAGNVSEDSASKLDWQQQKELQAQKRKLENQLKKCEDRIAVLEQRISEIEEEMALPEVATNVARLQELSKEQTSLSEELEQKYEEREELQS